jgi:hypothetical protein
LASTGGFLAQPQITPNRHNWESRIGNPSRAVALAQNRLVNAMLQILHELAESRLRDKVGGGLELTLNVFEENRMPESSRAPIKLDSALRKR